MIDVDKYWLQREELIKIGIFVTKLNSYFVWIATAPSKTPTQEPNWRLEPFYIIIKTNVSLPFFWRNPCKRFTRTLIHCFVCFAELNLFYETFVYISS